MTRIAGRRVVDCGMGRLAIALLLALGADDNSLTLRAFPRVQNVDLGRGCSEVLLTAEIRGPETERFYCPAVTWEFPDGTRASEESDCPPFEEREEFPRRWSRRVCAPAHPQGDAWIVTVKLSRSGHTVAQASVDFWVK